MDLLSGLLVAVLLVGVTFAAAFFLIRREPELDVETAYNIIMSTGDPYYSELWELYDNGTLEAVVYLRQRYPTQELQDMAVTLSEFQHRLPSGITVKVVH